MDNRSIGLTLVLIFYLVAFSMLLGDYKTWEPAYNRLVVAFKPINAKVFTSFKDHPRIAIESAGTLGILLTFAAMYGCKLSVKLLTFATLMFILAVNYTTSEARIVDFQQNVLWVFSLVALSGGLMQGW